VAERLVKLLTRSVGDERNLRAITESRQLTGEIFLRRRRDLGGSRQKWNQEEKKECKPEVQELQEFRSCRINGGFPPSVLTVLVRFQVPFLFFAPWRLYFCNS
jgi:hypothetical protein